MPRCTEVCSKTYVVFITALTAYIIQALLPHFQVIIIMFVSHVYKSKYVNDVSGPGISLNTHDIKFFLSKS
jgi:hypothetical protein